MADNNNNTFALNSRPTQIPPGDMQGKDNSIPLSPQWLLPKQGENKTGAVTGENLFRPYPGHVNLQDIPKLSGTGEDSNDNQKKKNVFRPSVLDMESGRRDRWRDEERETNSSVRKDRWKDGEREQHIDNRNRVDRKVDSSGRHFGEVRRAPGERWADSGNKDNHDQRRDTTKWSSRWGPGAKEADSVHEKWADPNKEADMLLEKGSSHIPYHGKDERDGDHHRPWRSNSSYSRGRGDPVLTPNKQAPVFSHGRGRGESPASTFSLGRGRVSSGGSSITQTTISLQPHGPAIEKGESGHGEPYPLKYNRTKLIEIYRTTDMRPVAKYLEGLVDVPSLTQEEPTEPLAFCEPTPEELVILKGIDKGEILNSGAPPVSKDVPPGRNTTDFLQSRRSRIGSKDDLPDSLDDSKHEGPGYHKDGFSNYSEASRAETAVHRKNDVSTTSSASGHPSPHQSGPWRPPSLAERSNSTHDWRERSSEIQKDSNNFRANSMLESPNSRKEDPKWGDDTTIRRQAPAGFNREIEPTKISQPLPEDLVLHYKDPQGEIQGPFAGSDIINWFESGYFGIDLQVRLAGAPVDSPFYLLGDVMPHLRAKARPPPGFSTPKLNETQDVSGRAVSAEPDVLKNDPRYKHGLPVESENRFLESLKTGSMSTAPFSEGMQGYGGNSTGALPSLGSVPNPYSFWPGRDVTPLTDNSRVQHHSQNVDPMAALQGLPNRSTSSVNNGISSWLNFPVQSGLAPLQNNLDIHQSQNIPQQSQFEVQQRLRNAPVNNLLAQSIDNASNMLTPEKLLASGLSQDPQLLNLLQQQYLLQLQSQAPVASQQPSILDQLLLLKQQQQKQEEQQQLMRQQQQLLSQVFPEHHLNQRLAEPTFAQLQTGGYVAGNAIADHARVQHHDLFQMDARLQAPSMQDENVSSADLVLPHQIFANNVKQKDWNASLPEETVKEKKGSGIADGLDTAQMSETANKNVLHLPPQLAVHEKEKLFDKNANAFEEPGEVEEQVPEALEIKRSSDKKSKKQKSSKVSTESAKGISKSQQSISADIEVTNSGDALAASVAKKEKTKTDKVAVDDAEKGVIAESKGETGQVVYGSQVNLQTQRAWNPAPGFKPKSLLEIQQEEQRRAAEQQLSVSDIATSLSSMNVSNPWGGAVVNADHKTVTETRPDSAKMELNVAKSDSSSNAMNNKSQEEDLFWGSSNIEKLDDRASGLPATPIISSHSDSVNGDDFIDAKDSKKSRKKSAKAKNAGAKVAPVVDVSLGSSPSDKGKNARLTQPKEVLPSVPSGPSFGDYVVWKGESASPSPAPAWSTDSGKPHKTASLRDILKEQEKKGSSSVQAVQIPTPQKPATNQPTRASGGPSWLLSPTPAKTASPLPINSQAPSQSKHKVEDDLFWGPLEPKPDTKQPDFPQLGKGSKTTPAKATLGGSLNRQKSTGGKPATDYSLSSAQSSQKGKKNTSTKQSEAMDFKEWCESECTRLTGSKDTSILEYCLKISRFEAETLLIENLGSVDSNHAFIDKFLNYKDFLPSDVVEIAFKNMNDKNPTASGVGNMTSDYSDHSGPDPGSVGGAIDGTNKGGKKKGKKGKKVSPAVLGFNVVSNRIMMGEIQTVDD